MDYLEQFLKTLPDPQRQQLLQAIGDKQSSGEIKSEEELQRELEKSLAELGNIPITPDVTYRPQSEQTNSADYNAFIQEVDKALRAIFSESGKIDRAIEDHQKLDQATLANIAKGIKRLNDKIDEYETIARNTEGYIQNAYETFRDSNSFEDDPGMITERDGTPVPEMAASIDSRAETLVLPATSDYDRIISSSGNRMADIHMLKQIGSGFIEEANQTHGIKYAIDGSNDTFWCSVILTDSPFEVTWYDRFNPSKAVITHGAGCNFEIVFQSVCAVSEITLRPFSEFPVDILQIRTYENLNHDCKPNYEMLERRSSEGAITIQFPAVECQRIEFVVNQPHYTVQSYRVREDQVTNTELWSRIYNAERDAITAVDAQGDSLWEQGEDDVEKTTLTESGLNSYWQSFESEFSKLVGSTVPTKAEDFITIAKDAAESATGTQAANRKKLIHKYEYIYGFYEIAVRGRSRMATGVYVSKPIKTKGNVKQVILDTDEEHVALCYDPIARRVALPSATIDDAEEDLFTGTAVEWYVSPCSQTTWYPILPLGAVRSGTPYVTCELLHLSSGSATTRFPMVSNSVKVRRNGEPLTLTKDYTVDATTIKIVNPISTDIYSVEYEVDDTSKDPFRVDFEEEGLDTTPFRDIFTEGTSRANAVKLSHHPYVDYAKIYETANYDPNKDYRPVTVTVKSDKTYLPSDGTTTQERMCNKTDYLTQVRDILTPYGTSHKEHDYRHDGQSIVFADSWAPGSRITVEYNYQVSDVRIKAILRRVVPGFESITPVVQDYSVKFRTINKI